MKTNKIYDTLILTLNFLVKTKQKKPIKQKTIKKSQSSSKGAFFPKLTKKKEFSGNEQITGSSHGPREVVSLGLGHI